MPLFLRVGSGPSDLREGRGARRGPPRASVWGAWRRERTCNSKRQPRVPIRTVEFRSVGEERLVAGASGTVRPRAWQDWRRGRHDDHRQCTAVAIRQQIKGTLRRFGGDAQPNEGERRRGRGALRGQIATRCRDTRSPPLGCGAQSPYASPAARFEGEIRAIAYEFIPLRAFNSARSVRRCSRARPRCASASVCGATAQIEGCRASTTRPSLL
jgi:hypothetical protein